MLNFATRKKQHPNTMKKITLNGNTANWPNLNVDALNTRDGKLHTTTNIPEDMNLIVTLADTFDPLCPDIDAVPEAVSGWAARHGRKRHFLLLNGGRVVGWAHFHRKPKDYYVRVSVTTYDTYNVKAKSEREALQKATYLAVQQYRGNVLSARVLSDEEVEAEFNPVDLNEE